MPDLQRIRSASEPARRRILGTLAPAALGCFLGFHYGRYFGDPDLPTRMGLPGLYATLGAVVAILVVRLTSLLWMIIRDFALRE